MLSVMYAKKACTGLWRGFRWIGSAGLGDHQEEIFWQGTFLDSSADRMEGMRAYAQKMFYMQGIGRHSRDEKIVIASADLKALSDFLGAKPYFLAML